jgi:hypothetical protein
MGLVLAVIWFAGLLIVVAGIVFAVRTIWRLPIVRKVLRAIVLEIGG